MGHEMAYRVHVQQGCDRTEGWVCVGQMDLLDQAFRAVLTSREELRGLMARRDISVRGLAGLAGLAHHSMIQQLRDGSRPGCKVPTAVAIASALAVDPNELFAFVYRSSG